MSLQTNLSRLTDRLWPWGRIKRLRAALDAVTNTGVYPAAVVGGPNAYERRTPYMDGWNDCAIESLRRLQGILKPGDWPRSDVEPDD